VHYADRGTLIETNNYERERGERYERVVVGKKSDPNALGILELFFLV
jgi:hypothetical protein